MPETVGRPLGTARSVLVERGNLIRRGRKFRKEDRIAEILEERGDHPGLVHIFSAMETCSTFEPWYDKKKQKAFLRRDGGRCLHYYFYLVDPVLGLCYVRVPTWAPFRLQVYFNAHHWLARQLEDRGVRFQLADNAFLHIDDFSAAQQLSDAFDVQPLQKALDTFAAVFCPVARKLGSHYRWSLMQVEYATDIVFKGQGQGGPAEDLRRDHPRRGPRREG